MKETESIRERVKQTREIYTIYTERESENGKISKLPCHSFQFASKSKSEPQEWIQARLINAIIPFSLVIRMLILWKCCPST